jgi:hypothetical protein
MSRLSHARAARVALSLALLTLTATGCQTVFTGITKIDDNTYYLTRAKNNNRSTLFLCSPIGQSADLHCREIATPD